MLLSLGIDPFYYNIEKWILSQSLDPIIVNKVSTPKLSHDGFTLWRSVFLKELHDWSWHETEIRIADSLSLRCFVRVEQLNERTPVEKTMQLFWEHNEKPLKEVLAFTSAVWTQAAQGKPKFSQWTWIKMMDQWAQRTIQGYRI